jgi:hypothetical protein
MKIVSFEWKDAYGNGGWFNREELKAVIDDVDMWTHTVGFLIKKTKREIIVCTTWQPKNECHRMEEKFCNIHKIPTSWVRNYIVLGNTDRPNLRLLSNQRRSK